MTDEEARAQRLLWDEEDFDKMLKQAVPYGTVADLVDSKKEV